MQEVFATHSLLSLFGAEALSLCDFTKINEQIRPVAYFGLPIIVIAAIMELVAQARERKQENFDHKESVFSIFVGMGWFASSYFTKAIMFAGIVWVYNIVPWRMELNWWMFIPCYIIHDFIAYWRHRISHGSRFWWSIHVPHHSANHYNLWINFRQSWFEQLNVFFFVPMLFMGFHPVLYFVVHQLNSILQFWVHTEYIGRFPKWIEYVMVTPTSHKVHHARNEKYIDKNFGNTFLIWDRMYGTFEDLSEKPVYGLTEPVHTNNILRIVFDEAISIAKDVRTARGPMEKIRMVFGSPGKIAAMKKMRSVELVKKCEVDPNAPKLGCDGCRNNVCKPVFA